MSTKIAKLKVSYPHIDPMDATGKRPRYRVEQANNTVAYAPGEYLNKKAVEDLCEANAWDITIVPVKI